MPRKLYLNKHHFKKKKKTSLAGRHHKIGNLVVGEKEKNSYSPAWNADFILMLAVKG